MMSLHIICEKFEEIVPVLQSVRKRTKPPTVDLYEVLFAVLYLLRSSCQWRMLPRDFPKWRTVHSYFSKWSEPDQYGISAQERALKNQIGTVRGRQGRSAKPMLLTMQRDKAGLDKIQSVCWVTEEAI